MSCTKTGANIFIKPHRMFAHGDAFELNGVGVFRIVGSSFNPAGYDAIHYTVHDYSNWFDETGRISTLLSVKFTNHGVDGVPFEEAKA